MNPRLLGGAIASNIGPVVSWLKTVKGKPVYITVTKAGKYPVVAGPLPIKRSAKVTIAVMTFPNTQVAAIPIFAKIYGVTSVEGMT